MIKTYIPRPAYLQKIRPFIGKEMIKVLTGHRRAGKSYILFQVMDHIKKISPKRKIIHIDMESEINQTIHDPPSLLAYIRSQTGGKGTAAIFIDEVQEIIDFSKALRTLLSAGHDIYCTGSNSKLMSADIAGILSGRTIEIPIRGLSYPEFLTFHKLADSDETLSLFLKFGGLPYLIHLDLEEETAFEYLKNIYNTILLKDVVARNNLRDVHFLNQLFDYLVDTTGQLVSAKNISTYLISQKISTNVNTVLHYLSALTSSFLIDKVRRYDIHGRKLFEINDKFYFQDLGIRNALHGLKQLDIGKIMENAVYNSLKLRGFKVNIGQLGNKKIDFCAEKNGDIVYIQVAYLISDNKTHAREFGNLLAIKDNYRKIIVSLDPVIGKGEKGIEHLSLRQFLLEETKS